MIYINSIGGYYYKIYQNGKKKRISKTEFVKKQRNGGGNGCSTPQIIPARKIDTTRFKNLIKGKTLSVCIGELLKTTLEILIYIKGRRAKCTLVCGGQSPAYFCLAMEYLPDFTNELIDILILPFSIGGKELKEKKINEYITTLRNKNITLQNRVYILDFVNTGVGINSLSKILQQYQANSCIIKLALLKEQPTEKKIYESLPCSEDGRPCEYLACESQNSKPLDIAKEFYIPSMANFSDNYPRIVDQCLPNDFSNPKKFCPCFKVDNNDIATMVIELAKIYTDHTSISSNLWYTLNDI